LDIKSIEAELLRATLHQQGIERSIPDVLEQLGQIREVGVVYPPQGKRRTSTIEMTVSAMSSEQRALYHALDLGRYLAS
jgi:hypothetical protein